MEFDTRTSEVYYLDIWYTCEMINKFLAPLPGILSSYLVVIPFQFISNSSILHFAILLSHSFFHNLHGSACFCICEVELQLEI